ncbi:DNA polymerase I [Oleiphilus sp. HI0009]|uniref:DNA polymerase I n=1 Tax=Oleiphilus sp. HI0125 TaxID=1822266 RepID=UPI0007C21DDB|nr:DNA polymerase I [Oleiphilus sp. HI0125]KZX76788.1 DNA polymerase I [Oleiphilus sp. HI0009]KZZ58496.1 DNA polymerase I [Oleiphilus sp. HI0125]
MTTSAPTVLVDGSSYLFRAYHALPPLNNSKGQPTGAIKGVINMMKRLQSDYPDSKIIVVFDAKGKNFRHEMYEDYKANRPPMPDDLRSQIQPIHDIIQAMGLPLLVIAGVEADDVIGTLAKQATDTQHDVVVSTGDKDMAQLVTPHVTLMNTMTNIYMNEEGVVEKFGVKPNQIIDYLALVGDTVDNIPGVPKCGPKTAVKWLGQYESLKGVMENADSVGGKIGENLRNALELLPLSYELATIKCDIELEQNLGDITQESPNLDALRELYTEFEFKSLLNALDATGTTPEGSDSENKAPAVEIKKEYDIVLEQAQFDDWLARLKAAPYFAFDTETTSLDYMQARVVGVSFSCEAGKAAYVPFGHDYLGAPQQLDQDAVLASLKPLLENPAVLKLGQNLKYDRNVLLNHGITLEGIEHDTMVESYVLNSTGSRHDMDTLAEKYLNRTTIHFEDIAGKGAKQLTFNQIDIEKAGPYAAEDADITLQLHEALFPQLSEEKGLLSVYQEIDKPLVRVLSNIERRGAKVDAHKLAQQSQELEQRISELEKEAYELAGEEFNLASPKQLQAIFFEKLELPIIKKTPKGQPSTAEPVLQELALDYPLPKLILEHRSLAKLKSTYTDKLPQLINASTGRIHTSYHQAVTATGRLSSSDPNLQNIPIRTAEGRRIRQAFVAEQGYKLIAADYSQIELRIMAHLSQDKGLLDAFAHGADVHKTTAAEVFEVALEEVTSDQRRKAKAINFGLIYGMSAFGLAKQIKVERYEAQDYIDRYFERYPGVLDYMDRIRKQAHDDGYVETVFGRRLYLPDINARNKMMQQAAERTAINAPMQGTAADIIKRAMLDVETALASSELDAKMIMQVHDELIVEVREDQVDEIASLLSELMMGAANLDVPLIVEAGIGDNWDEAH